MPVTTAVRPFKISGVGRSPAGLLPAAALRGQNSGALAAVLRFFKLFMRSPRVGGNAVLAVNALELALRHESVRPLRDLEDDETRCPSIAHQPAFSDQATGRYFRVTGESASQPQAADNALAHELWERSLRWAESTAECTDSEC